VQVFITAGTDVTVGSQDISVDRAAGRRLSVQVSNLGRGNISVFSTSSRPILGPTQTHIQWIPGALSPGGGGGGVKLTEREADHLSPPSAEVKNGGAILSFSDISSWCSA
jgi:hypothetical protein